MRDTNPTRGALVVKRLSVALISLETDALDILTSGVNNTNSKRRKKRMKDVEHARQELRCTPIILFTHFFNCAITKPPLPLRTNLSLRFRPIPAGFRLNGSFRNAVLRSPFWLSTALKKTHASADRRVARSVCERCTDMSRLAGILEIEQAARRAAEANG